eukprot:Trichotokara_eunicae@DN819_c0_g1_i1.p1
MVDKDLPPVHGDGEPKWNDQGRGNAAAAGGHLQQQQMNPYMQQHKKQHVPQYQHAGYQGRGNPSSFGSYGSFSASHGYGQNTNTQPPGLYTQNIYPHHTQTLMSGNTPGYPSASSGHNNFGGQQAGGQQHHGQQQHYHGSPAAAAAFQQQQQQAAQQQQIGQHPQHRL